MISSLVRIMLEEMGLDKLQEDYFELLVQTFQYAYHADNPVLYIALVSAIKDSIEEVS